MKVAFGCFGAGLADTSPPRSHRTSSARPSGAFRRCTARALLPLYATPWNGFLPLPNHRHLFVRLPGLTFWSPISPLGCSGATRARHSAGISPSSRRVFSSVSTAKLLVVMLRERNASSCIRRPPTPFGPFVRGAHAPEVHSGWWRFGRWKLWVESHS